MRITCLTTCLLFICTSLSAQYSRSLYPTTQPGYPRTAAIAEVNGENYFLSVKESAIDTIKILTGRIDALGETDNYQFMNVSGYPFSFLAVSGMAEDNSGRLNCAIITNDASLGALRYLRIDPVNATTQVVFSLPFDVEGPFAPTRIKGDSLITYITQEAVGLVRIAANIDDPSNYSYDLVEPGVAITGSLAGGARHLEFKMDDSGNEYVWVKGKLYKRTAPGVYQVSAASTTFVPQEPTGITLEVNANGEIMVINPAKYERFNSSLTSVAAGMHNLNVMGGTRFFELRSSGNDWKFYVMNSDQEMEAITFNNALNVSDRMEISPNTQPHALLEVGGIPYLVSERQSSALGFTNSLYCAGFMQLNGTNPLPFIEFGQEMEHDMLNAAVGHLGSDFIGDGLKPGIRYTHNNLERTVMFYGSSYLVGKDANGALYSTYTSQANLSTLPGPFSPVSTGNLELIDRYSRGYYVSRDMIDEHITQITNANPSYVIPFGIREWPAHGDTWLGQAADLAPFVDQNNNGIYEPELGDYPSIYGTQCILNIYHGDLQFNASGLETHQYIYTLDCDTSETINSSIFVTNRIFARNGDFTESYFTKFSDGDNGNPFDDYLGTNVELGMTYIYNADLYDEPYGGAIGFNDTLPAQGFQILKGIKIADDGMDNDGTGGFPVNAYGLSDGTPDNEFSTLESSMRYSPSTSVTTPAMFYNVAQGILPNGTPNSVNGVDIRFDYFGESDLSFYASGGVNHGNLNYEFINGNAPGDRSIWGSSAQFDLSLGSMVEITGVYITAIDTTTNTTDLLAPVKHLFELGTILKGMYGNNMAGCDLTFDPYVSDLTLSTEEITPLPEFTLYPNPTGGDLYVRTEVSETCEWFLVDLQGNVLQTGELNGQTQISLHGLSAGIYLLNLKTDGQLISKRVVKYEQSRIE